MQDLWSKGKEEEKKEKEKEKKKEIKSKTLGKIKSNRFYMQLNFFLIIKTTKNTIVPTSSSFCS